MVELRAISIFFCINSILGKLNQFSFIVHSGWWESRLPSVRRVLLYLVIFGVLGSPVFGQALMENCGAVLKSPSSLGKPSKFFLNLNFFQKEGGGLSLKFRFFKGGATLQLSWSSKTNSWTMTLLFK